jgi:hypothetical protein
MVAAPTENHPAIKAMAALPTCHLALQGRVRVAELPGAAVTSWAGHPRESDELDRSRPLPLFLNNGCAGRSVFLLGRFRAGLETPP